jgi:hypothetical protein
MPVLLGVKGTTWRLLGDREGPLTVLQLALAYARSWCGQGRLLGAVVLGGTSTHNTVFAAVIRFDAMSYMTEVGSPRQRLRRDTRQVKGG